MKLPDIVGLIWAQDLHGVIGRDGQIPSEFKSDFDYFKSVTLNTTVVMGRKTWESLPKKPLPNRVNVVLTSDKNYRVPEGVRVISSLEELTVDTESVYFIGGEKVYEIALPLANRIHATVNNVAVKGDTRVPKIRDLLNSGEWVVDKRIDRFETLGQLIYELKRTHP